MLVGIVMNHLNLCEIDIIFGKSDKFKRKKTTLNEKLKKKKNVKLNLTNLKKKKFQHFFFSPNICQAKSGVISFSVKGGWGDGLESENQSCSECSHFGIF